MFYLLLISILFLVHAFKLLLMMTLELKMFSRFLEGFLIRVVIQCLEEVQGFLETRQ